MTENFWQNKKVIVTGGAGFLGSFVTEKLKQRGVTAERIFIPRIETYNLTNPFRNLQGSSLDVWKIDAVLEIRRENAGRERGATSQGNSLEI